MPRFLSASQIERLGARLVASREPDPADLLLLRRLLADYDDVLGATLERVRQGLDVSPTSRIKNTGTILEKLHRYGGSWLKSLHDLAGMRIVGSFDRAGQDALVEELVELFQNEARSPRVVDRRGEPVQGYRAVHVIVFPDRTPVEVQVRTSWQHQWAELFEKLADQFGRGIRYGEPPARLSPSGVDGKEVIALTISIADSIDAFERLETRKDSERIDELRPLLDNLIAGLRSLLETL